MALYYLCTRYRDSYSHEHSVDLHDIVTAQREVSGAAREIIADLVAQGGDIRDIRFEVRDENGNTIVISPFESIH